MWSECGTIVVTFKAVGGPYIHLGHSEAVQPTTYSHIGGLRSFREAVA